VAADCTAINATTFESELFGHTMGALTGATSEHPGLIRSSQGGPLLRTLQEPEVRPVGGLRPIPFDARVLVATNRDLATGIESGRFRMDLFFRTSTLRLQVPPLRERGTDVVVLFRHFLSDDGNVPIAEPKIDDEAKDLLLRYPWPGNVRELRNVAHHVHTFVGRKNVTVEALPNYIRASVESVDGGSSGRSIRSLERVMIAETLHDLGGNRRLTARRPGISEATLYRRLREYGLSAEET